MDEESPEFQKNSIVFLSALNDEMREVGAITFGYDLIKLGGHFDFTEQQTLNLIGIFLSNGYIRYTNGTSQFEVTQLGRQLIKKTNLQQKKIQDNDAQNKYCIFISHINEDKHIAISLKRLLQSAFGEKIEVFVSSDLESVPLGSQWFSEIADGLRNCHIAIVLCSPVSITRPWINFEAGAAFVSDKPVIPLCYNGLDREKLPVPLSFLQAGNANDEPTLMRLIDQIAKKIEILSPKIDIINSEFFNIISTRNNSELKPFISATLRSSIVTKGEDLLISGSTSYPNSEVEIELFKFGTEQDKKLAFSAATGSDGSFHISQRSDSFNPGQYGMTIQLPKGEWTKLSFLVEDNKKSRKR
jgi:hypothetical protein